MSNLLPVLALTLGLDSLAVGVGLGAPVRDARRRLRLALAFALCDGLASFLGWALGVAAWRDSLEWAGWIGPAAVAGYGLYVLGLAWQSSRLSEAGAGGWLVLALPLCLSLDNLAAGVGPDASAGAAAVAALALGAFSGCLAWSGLRLGSAAAARAWLRAEWLGGAALLLVAAALCCREFLS
jgi:putative Mn2+ efflux pump MntP